jgi:hypothetical protein
MLNGALLSVGADRRYVECRCDESGGASVSFDNNKVVTEFAIVESGYLNFLSQKRDSLLKSLVT